MTKEEIHENLILLEYEEYSKKEYKPMSYAKFVTQKLIEARSELSKLHQPTVSDLVCDNCGNDFFVTTIGGNKKCHRCGKAIKHT